MQLYVTVLAGPTAAESRPVVSSSHPEVVQAVVSAIEQRLDESGDLSGATPTAEATNVGPASTDGMPEGRDCG